MTSLARRFLNIISFSGLTSYRTHSPKIENLNYILSEIYHMDTQTLKSSYVERQRTRYNGRVKKRMWDDKANESSSEAKKLCSEAFERVKRKKAALLFAYSGANYFGMQRNPGMKTIEEDLLKALLVTKNITDEAFAQIQTIQFQRAARTDKGVSAAMQVVSLKLPEVVDISAINENLPPEIRVMGIKRVTKGFNSKSKCDARTYSYMLPTFSFEKHDQVIDNHFEYKVSPGVIEQVNCILKKYEGTKNFHNFTSRKSFVDPSSRRYIISFFCGEPFIMDGMEFAIIHVKGQSFMMHQIRKMIGLSLAIIRGLTTEDKVDKAFTSDRIDIPTAPGLGLVLDEIHYDRYNSRFGKDGIHEPLTWDEFRTQLDEFKKAFIYPKIVAVEKEETPMALWLETLPLHSYDIRDADRRIEEEGENDESDDENVELREKYETKDKIEEKSGNKKMQTEIVSETKETTKDEVQVEDKKTIASVS